MINSNDSANISNERFSVIYQLYGSEKEVCSKARDICLEQTVEFPEELIPEGFIREQIIGHIESVKPLHDLYFEVTISYLIEITGDESTQLLNIIFGNISIKPGIRVISLKFPENLLNKFKGPRFGKSGLRGLLNVSDKPLLCTALKPLGMSSKEFADLAYKFALGGIEIIKDDHGLTNQSFSRFEERVSLCSEAVTKANNETGQNCIYSPNITAPFDKIMERTKIAKRSGAGGLLIEPGIVGLDTMRFIADDNDIALPIFSHPSFQGSYVINKDSGISHGVLFGQIARLFGADAVIYPNYGGRFSFTKEECREIITGSSDSMFNINPIFPCPGGGMGLDRIPEMLEFYGNDVIFLIGGGLFTQGSDLVENCRLFRKLVDESE